MLLPKDKGNMILVESQISNLPASYREKSPQQIMHFQM